MTMTKGMYSSKTPEWSTPPDLFAELDAEFGFTLDPCCTNENATCDYHFTEEDDGLSQSWEGHTVFMNPPYGRAIGNWLRKAYVETHHPHTCVVCLVPSRTDTAWWHNFCMKGEIRFIRGRLRFGDSKNPAPFPSAIVIFGRKRDAKK